MAAIITCNTLIISSKPTISYLSHRKTSKRCRISSNATATAFKLCSSQRTGAAVTCGQAPVTRRSGNYKPSFWDFDYIQSLNSEYKEERYLRRCSELKVKVKMVMEEAMILMETVQQLELIDDLQRLGISYNFEDQIKNILNHIYEHKNNYHELKDRNIYSTALEFRLLRQHGFVVSQDVFTCFKNEEGEFKASLAEDTKGLLQLYESSFLLTEGESTLDQAREFATVSLRRNLDQALINDEDLSLLVRQALELPFHWSVARTNARAFIEAYERRPDMNPTVLELAKLHFNIFQAIHQEELKLVSRWWKSRRLTKSLPFARDRAVENYLWGVGMIVSREYGDQRILIGKMAGLLTTVDDIFDVYGTLEELQLFADAFQRWDIELIGQLPEYMQVCFLAVYNFINEVAYDVLNEKGCIVIKYLQESWADVTRAYMQEAIWYHNVHTPTLDDYLDNGLISSADPVLLTHLFFLSRNSIQKEAVDDSYKCHNIVRLPSLIVRLVDDLGTGPIEMERGDVSNTMECYMKESNASEKEAQEYRKYLIRETWKKINKEILLAPDCCSSSFSQDFITGSVNSGRMTHYVYLHGDGQGVQHSGIKDRTTNLLFKPIQLN